VNCGRIPKILMSPLIPEWRAAVGVPVVAMLILLPTACSSMPISAPTSSPVFPTSVPLATAVEAGTLLLPATLVPPSPEAAPPIPVFGAAVIVDARSEPVMREQAAELIREANSFLQPLSSINLLMTDYSEDGAGGSTNDMASRYVSAHAAALPNGLVILAFGDDGRAKRDGGYSYAIAGPPGFTNAFVSPLTGSEQIYVVVVHYNHRYAECGYGGTDTATSTTALQGECRGQTGLACVQRNGYPMCSDSTMHLYASTRTHAVASSIVHELLHLFSPGGDLDHYDTPECRSRMGYPEQFRDLQETQYNNGLCPYVYEEFRRSYQP